MTDNMGTTLTADRVTNIELGTLLDLSHVQIHRIRTGSRLPSIDAMVRIEELLAWPIKDQVQARTATRYAEQFEEAIARYAVARNTAAGPGERTPTPQTD